MPPPGRWKGKLARIVPKTLVLGMVKWTAAALRERGSIQRRAHDILSEHGFHLLKKHYYLPIPEKGDLDEAFWSRQSDLVGLALNTDLYLSLLADVFTRYLEEFRLIFPLNARPDGKGFHLINGRFMAVDAHVYYAFIRHFRPQRIVEIGAGQSTLLAAEAARQCGLGGGRAPAITAIEPYPSAELRAGTGVSRLIERRVQDVPLEEFTALRAGDILFIDSTHVLRAGGDVQYEYLEILPRLAPGVLVHVHDISLPRPYPRVYFEQNHYYWNEQYLLQAFLAFNDRFEILWPGNYMMLRYPEKVAGLFTEYAAMRQAYPESEPSSFWIRVRS